MRTSETVAKIADAMSKAQAEMTGAKKTATNPHFRSHYSDLAEIIRAISGPFAANGLCFVQSPGVDESRVMVTTRIMHSSGEWIEGDTILPPTKNDAQGYGSAITYAKRYGLQAMAGLPSVDDDGNAATQQAPTQQSVPRHNKERVQKYLSEFVRALSDGDATYMLQLGDELKDTPEHSAVWAALSTAQKQAIKSAIHGLKAGD